MSLRYALLALLTAQPMTGYDLAKAFHVSVGHVWHAPNSQIYPELKRMVADGLIEDEPVPWGETSTKTQYSITDKGITAFCRWMDEPVNYPHERDPAHLRAAYFEWADPDAARRRLREHIEHYEERRGQWQAQLDAIRTRKHPTLARRLFTDTRHSPDAIVAFKVFTYEGFIERADLEISWAERGLALLDDLSEEDEQGPSSG
jgi:DNA-binding PadR family transcriptional regulator